MITTTNKSISYKYDDTNDWSCIMILNFAVIASIYSLLQYRLGLKDLFKKGIKLKSNILAFQTHLQCLQGRRLTL